MVARMRMPLLLEVMAFLVEREKNTRLESLTSVEFLHHPGTKVQRHRGTKQRSEIQRDTGT